MHVARYLGPARGCRRKADRARARALHRSAAARLARARGAPALPAAPGGVQRRGDGGARRLRRPAGTGGPRRASLYVAGDWVGGEGMLADASLASARARRPVVSCADCGAGGGRVSRAGWWQPRSVPHEPTCAGPRAAVPRTSAVPLGALLPPDGLRRRRRRSRAGDLRARPGAPARAHRRALAPVAGPGRDQPGPRPAAPPQAARATPGPWLPSPIETGDESRLPSYEPSRPSGADRPRGATSCWRASRSPFCWRSRR